MELSTDWDGLKDADDMLLINSLAMLCPFEPEEKQALLRSTISYYKARNFSNADGVCSKR
jgi:Lon protease-like protein